MRYKLRLFVSISHIEEKRFQMMLESYDSVWLSDPFN